jgi:hypothetical protein
MTLHPKDMRDLALAPVAAAIDLNLSRLRDAAPDQIVSELELQLDRPALVGDTAERAERIEEVAVRNVDLHGWSTTITDDYARLRMTGGSVSLDLGLSASIIDYIRGA